MKLGLLLNGDLFGDRGREGGVWAAISFDIYAKMYN